MTHEHEKGAKSRTANPAIRHHYVPQFYLRRWADTDGKVWEYRREPSGMVSERRVSPRATAFRDELYTERAGDPGASTTQPDWFETKVLGPVDCRAAPVLEKLVSGSPPCLSDQEKADWAAFINAQLERGLYTMADREAEIPRIVTARTQELLNRYRNDSAERQHQLHEALSEQDFCAVARNALLIHMAKEIQDQTVLNAFVGYRWMLLRPEPITFVTGDDPIVVNGGQSERPIFLFTMALSPQVLFVASKTDGDLEDETYNMLVLYHNLALLEGRSSYLYSQTRIEDGVVVRLRTAVEKAWGEINPRQTRANGPRSKSP